MLQSITYQVQEGESLSKIAQKFGLPSWKSIYYLPDNYRLRITRGSPDYLHVGDVLIIPPHPKQVLEYKIQRLEKIKADTQNLFNRMQTEIDQNYKNVSSYGMMVDGIAAVSQILVGLASLVKSGIDAMKLSGRELVKANHKLAIDHLKSTGQSLVESGLSASTLNMEPTANEEIYIAIPKILVKSWLDITSPSYWTQRITGVYPEQIHANLSNQLRREKSKALTHLDQQIKKLRMQQLELRTH